MKQNLEIFRSLSLFFLIIQLIGSLFKHKLELMLIKAIVKASIFDCSPFILSICDE